MTRDELRKIRFELDEEIYKLELAIEIPAPVTVRRVLETVEQIARVTLIELAEDKKKALSVTSSGKP